MSAQDLMLGARALHVRTLQAELAEKKAEATALRTELEALKAHFDLALLAAQDLRDGPLEIWDGWNLILGSPSAARDREVLEAEAARADRRIWIVYDGQRENSVTKGNVRVSYTGGTGEHRADRLITDFVRMAFFRGLAERITVRTNDRDFRRQIARFGARVAP